jgi:hypothetical protein
VFRATPTADTNPGEKATLEVPFVEPPLPTGTFEEQLRPLRAATAWQVTVSFKTKYLQASLPKPHDPSLVAPDQN